ncbi:MAG: iron-sulfur cluster-binding domain-containing protein [Myxococcota bacterium]|jgi:ferredoxin-NADP reductase|nr:iron-sulfur cluster-binding domain-containing protein [Myxococcota bacterium]
MALRDLLAIVRDGRTALTTLARWRGLPALVEGLPCGPGDVQAVVERFHPASVRMRVAGILEQTATSRVLRLVPVSGAAFPPFRAGQYVHVSVCVAGVHTGRAYSICSPPSSVDGIEILVRRKVDGLVSPWLTDQVGVGDELSVSGPAGELVHDPLRDTRDLVLIGGGSGIAPLVAIVRDALARDLPLRLRLLYGARHQDDRPYQALLDGLAARQPDRLQVVYVLSEPLAGWTGATGLLDLDFLRRGLGAGDPAGKTVFLCGPPPMHRLVRPALLELGVPRRRIHEEAFGPPDDVTREPGWPAGLSAEQVFTVTVQTSAGSRPIAAPAGWPLLASLERAGLVVPALCRTGVCATCRTRLLQGAVFVPPGTELRASDHEAGFIHPCLSYPTGDLTLRLP